jgi:hypothetical protein
MHTHIPGRHSLNTESRHEQRLNTLDKVVGILVLTRVLAIVLIELAFEALRKDLAVFNNTLATR